MQKNNIKELASRKPHAIAVIKGSPEYPQIYGIAKLYQTKVGVIVLTEIVGLPSNGAFSDSSVFAYHIHEGESCTGNAEDPFADAKMHYNPLSALHPYHKGDLPPLFSANGIAFSAVLTDRFAVSEVIGKTVIIHDRPDDFATQPSGNSGNKIACGVITFSR